jgi:hypothetical protein
MVAVTYVADIDASRAFIASQDDRGIAGFLSRRRG